MPRVKFVNLSFNSLTEQLVNVDNRNPFLYLKNLVLNATCINWKSIRELLQLLPRFVLFYDWNLSIEICLLFHEITRHGLKICKFKIQ